VVHRSRRAVGSSLVALLALAMLVAPAAGAQVFVDLEDRRLGLEPGRTTTTNVTLSNPTNRSYVVQASAAVNISAETDVQPRRTDVGPDRDRSLRLSVTPDEDSTFLEGDLHLSLQLIDRETGEASERVERIGLTMNPPLLYMGAVENPLPAAYDGPGWLFALEAATWALAAALLAAATRTVTNRVVPAAAEEVQAEMAGKIRAPVAALPIILGGRFSWRLLPRNAFVDGLATALEVLAVVVVSLVAYRVLSAGLVYYQERSTGKRRSPTESMLVPVLEKLGAAAVITVAGFLLMRALEVDVSFLLGGGLVAGLVISMAAQDTLANFFSGLHILLDQPFREGDVLQLESGEVCQVRRIGLRSTKLYHFQNHQEIIAPNDDLATKRVVNMSYPDSQYRLVVPFGVAYDADLDEVTNLVHNIAMDVDEVIKGRNTEPRVIVREFGESSINLDLRVLLPTERDRFTAQTKLIKRIHDAFEAEGIEIPFPQRVLRVRDGEEDPPTGPEPTPEAFEEADGDPDGPD